MDGIIRRSRLADHGWITEVAAEVYRDLGDYRVILPPWLEHPGVSTWVEEGPAHRTLVHRGFVLIGLHGIGAGGEWVAELVALAVAPRHQGRGVGRALLDHAIGVAEQACCSARCGFLTLTVAGNNTVGRHLYESAGFQTIPGDHGCYDGGQPVVRMVRPLSGGGVQRCGSH